MTPVRPDRGKAATWTIIQIRRKFDNRKIYEESYFNITLFRHAV